MLPVRRQLLNRRSVNLVKIAKFPENIKILELFNFFHEITLVEVTNFPGKFKILELLNFFCEITLVT